jgi:hypothetical protein
MTKTIRSQFEYEIGSIVESFTILEKHTVISPVPLNQRRAVYEYLVDRPPTATKTRPAPNALKVAPERGSFTRSTPEQRSGVVRRVPSR